ncbi:MAG TPA: glycosyltransferase [Candidatus Paceibacterota bacterium]|nr:glycosyltransferase [Candidatus Paceibacterota bacterium]
MRHSYAKYPIYAVLYVVNAAIIFSPFILHPTPHDTFPFVRAVIIFFASVLLTKYFVYMMLSPIYDVWAARRNRKFRDEILAYRPDVSIVIPAWNEEVGIVRTMRSALENSYRGSLEVVVVNDGSTDNSDAVIRAFQKEYEASAAAHPNRRLVYRYKGNGGKGSALNEGIRLSGGEIIMTIDADCYVTPTAVENFVKQFVDPKVMAAVGNVKIGNTGTLIGTIQYLEFLFSFYFKKADSLMNTIYIIGGAAGAFRREVFEKVGLYDTGHITEDIDFSVRIQAAGMRIVYAANAIVYTEGASDIEGLMKQRLRWKRGRFRTFWEHRGLFFNNGEGMSFALTFVILPFAVFGDVQLFGELFFLLFLYIYSLWTSDFSSFFSGIVVVNSMFIVQLFDARSHIKKLPFFLVAPIAWMLFYVTSYVEHNALMKSVSGAIKKEELRWQRWQRHGVLEGNVR